MRIIPTEARSELSNAQFILGPEYIDWLWRERAKASTPAPKPSKAWPFKRFEDAGNVVEMPRKAKK